MVVLIKIGIQDILDQIKDFLKNIDWEELKEKARAFVKRLFEIINTILRDKEFWELLGKTVAEIVNYLFTIINEAVHDLDWKALGQAITTFLKNALETIDWALIRDTVVTLAKGLADMWNEVFADKHMLLMMLLLLTLTHLHGILISQIWQIPLH